MAEDFTIVRAGVPEIDDCKILTRLNAFVVPQGVAATLEYVLRGRTGNPVDLSDWLAGAPGLVIPVSESGSLSSSAALPVPPAGTVVLRIKEWLACGVGSAANPIWEVYGTAVDPARGVLRAQLGYNVVERAGIYDLNWAVVDARGRPVVVTHSILSVEKTLFPVYLHNAWDNLGPPTIQEVRMRLMDSAGAENTLLDDVEFKDEQILYAMTTPIATWNETPPPLRPAFTSKTFPYRAAWMTGILAQLLIMAAGNYRRNTFRSAAGQTSDKDKEKEYAAEGNRLWQEYMMWLYNKKVECNLKLFCGHNSSPYVSNFGW